MTVDMTIRRSVEVRVPLERAWATFTSGVGRWWPLKTHSLAERRAVDAIMEPRAGGVFYEVTDEGDTAVWADVVVWDPPQRLVLDWHVNPERPATELAVTFSAVEGGTRVDLEHSGWSGPEQRASYDGRDGWDLVLAAYVKSLGGA